MRAAQDSWTITIKNVRFPGRMHPQKFQIQNGQLHHYILQYASYLVNRYEIRNGHQKKKIP